MKDVNERSLALRDAIIDAVRRVVAGAGTVTAYREPLVAFAAADDPRFLTVRCVASPHHLMPQELLSGAQSVVSFFIPFEHSVVQANARDRETVAREWALAYVETNELIARTTAHLIEMLEAWGLRASAEPPTNNFDPAALVSRWSHKSVAVIAGLGSFGLHHMVITDSGCAGRFGSLVTDADLPTTDASSQARCLYLHDGSCQACVARCPIEALSETDGIDRQRCYARCLEMNERFNHLGPAEVCGKCAIGPCSFTSPV